MIKRKKPLISTVLVSWNRWHLLRNTINSYLKTITVPFELFIVDNNSKDGCQEIIKRICRNYDNCYPILLNKNIGGGLAINRGLNFASAPFLHISENDLTYKPGWDQKMLNTFEKFSNLGLLSLYSPFPQTELGEVSDVKPASKMNDNTNNTIYVAKYNIMTPSIFRRKIWDAGIRWENFGLNDFLFPNDRAFSIAVKNLGYLVAWNDEYLVVNNGHQIDEIRKNLSYYIKNYKVKPGGFQNFERRLKNLGYKLKTSSTSESGYIIVE
ncbi:MAG: glycosyltransferase [Halanaerobiales bacterium]|nr:glycosyltransferase [Halanaerobiales bacterium]